MIDVQLFGHLNVSRKAGFPLFSEMPFTVPRNPRSLDRRYFANISYRLGTKATVKEIHSRLGEVETNAEAEEDLERTRHYFSEAGVDLEKTPMTLGRHLRLAGEAHLALLYLMEELHFHFLKFAENFLFEKTHFLQEEVEGIADGQGESFPVSHRRGGKRAEDSAAPQG